MKMRLRGRWETRTFQTAAYGSIQSELTRFDNWAIQQATADVSLQG